MAKVFLSHEARNDLVEIGMQGAARFGDEVADAYQRDFDKSFQLLESFPEIGPLRGEFGVQVRWLLCNRHRIFYRLTGDIVRIVRILHVSQDPTRHLKP